MPTEQQNAIDHAKGALAPIQQPDDGSGEEGQSFVRVTAEKSEIEQILDKLEKQELINVVIELLAFLDISQQNIDSMLKVVAKRCKFPEEDDATQPDKG